MITRRAFNALCKFAADPTPVQPPVKRDNQSQNQQQQPQGGFNNSDFGHNVADVTKTINGSINKITNKVRPVGSKRIRPGVVGTAITIANNIGDAATHTDPDPVADSFLNELENAGN